MKADRTRVQWLLTFGTALVVWLVCGALIEPAAAYQGPELRLVPDQTTISILRGDQPVLRYRFADTPFKPYVRELFTPKGVNVLLDSPPDHVHHRGLMFAVAADGVSFWEEMDQAGRQINRAIGPLLPTRGDRGTVVGFVEELDWLSPEGKRLLREERMLQVLGDAEVESAGATLLTWTTRLESPPGAADVKLTGNHYFGLGLRFVRAMDKLGKFDNSEHAEGEVFRGDERLTRARWCAYASRVDDKPVTVAMFDHPDNVRHPATWFTMANPFAYLSATLNLHREPLTLKTAEPLELRYGVALWDGHVEAEKIEKLYQLWVSRFTDKRDVRPEGRKSKESKP
jgi:hypothetical protein